MRIYQCLDFVEFPANHKYFPHSRIEAEIGMLEDRIMYLKIR